MLPASCSCPSILLYERICAGWAGSESKQMAQQRCFRDRPQLQYVPRKSGFDEGAGDIAHPRGFLLRQRRCARIAAEVDPLLKAPAVCLATLVICCLDNEGRISKRRRAQFERRVPSGVFDFIEELATAHTPGGVPERPT